MTKQNDQERRDFILNGNLFKVIVVITLPLMSMSVLNSLFNIVDSIIVSYIGSLEVSAVAVINQIRGVILAISAGLATGGTIMLARLIGQNRFDKAKQLSQMLVIIAFCIGAFISFSGLFLSVPIMVLCKVPEKLIQIGSEYFIIQLFTLGLTLINNTCLCVDKSRGKTKNILIINVITMIAKISLTAFFVYVLKLGVTMVAIATLIPQIFIFIFCVLRLFSKSYTFKFEFKKNAIGVEYIGQIFKLAFPIFLGKFVFSVGKVVVNSMCSDLGDTVSGALSITNHMSASTTSLTESSEESIALIISQNIGNNNYKRAIKSFYIILLANIIISIVGVIILTIFNDSIINLFAKEDANFFYQINEIFKYEKLGIITLGLNSAVLGLLYGFGYTKTTFALNLARLFIFRIPSLYYMINYTSLGIKSVGIAMFLSNAGIGIMSLIVCVIYLIIIKEKYMKEKL